MVSASAGREARELAYPPSSPFKLRYLLMLILLGVAAKWIVPRGHAAWKLHNRAVAHANYAMCMVGPSGPALLQENPEGFLDLVRRRVLAAQPNDRPLEPCLELGEQVGIRHRAYRLHSAPAEDFLEYQNQPSSRARVSIRDLDLSLEELSDLADRAWPFVRSGAHKLMKPSSYAKEAPFTPSPPRAGRGSGLPAMRHRYRSTVAFGDVVVVSLGSGANARTLLSKNGGVDWVSGGSRLAEDVRDRCVADDEGRAFTLSRMNDGRRIVLSQGPSAAPQVASLGSPDEEIAGVSCDESALVAAMVQPKDESGNHPVVLRICPFRRPCKDMNPPNTGSARLYYPVDVARAGGDTIVARSSGGITRVSSSRDDGRSWVPWTVAYDHSQEEKGLSPPFRLLVAADRILLYSGASDARPYALLVSDDHGASFRAPETFETESSHPLTISSTR